MSNNHCSFYNENTLRLNCLLIFLLTVKLLLFFLFAVFHRNPRLTSLAVNWVVLSDAWRQETCHAFLERTSNFTGNWFELN